MSVEIESEESTSSYVSAEMVLLSSGPRVYVEDDRVWGFPCDELGQGTSVLITGTRLIPVCQTIVLKRLEETTTQLREELKRRDEAHQKELIARDELHKKEVERLIGLIQTNKEESRRRDESFRKELCELKALVQQLVQTLHTNKAESGPETLETLEETTAQSVPTLNEDHISETVDDKSVIPAMPTKVEEARLEKLNDRDEVHKTEVKGKMTVDKPQLPATQTKMGNGPLLEATQSEEDQPLERPEKIDIKELNTIASSSNEPTPIDMDLTAPSLSELQNFFNSIM